MSFHHKLRLKLVRWLATSTCGSFLFFIEAPAQGSTPGSSPTAEFDVENRHFSTLGGGPYLSLNPGRELVLEGSNDGHETVLVITVLAEIHEVVIPARDGLRTIQTRVVEEREYVDGELEDASRFFYARCLETSDIYQFGEWTRDFENEPFLGYAERWEAGVGGAQPGIVMPGTFMIGARYVQGVEPGEEISHAENLAMGVKVETPAGTFQNCIKIREYDPIEADDRESGGPPSIKLFAPGVGLVADEDLRLTRVRLGVFEAIPAEYQFRSTSDHRYLPFVPGQRSVFAGGEDSTDSWREVEVLTETREIVLDGSESFRRVIETRVVAEREYEGTRLDKITQRYLAQCVQSGDIFLFGETVVFESSGSTTHENDQWLAGVAEAKPALLMPASFVAGAIYIPAGRPGGGVAKESRYLEDCLRVTVPAGTFEDCIRLETKVSSSDGEESLVQRETFAPNLGCVRDGKGRGLVEWDRPTWETSAGLTIEPSVTLSWPASGRRGARLEHSGDLRVWRPVPRPPALENDRHWLAFPRSAMAQYYRLVPGDSD